MSFFVVIELSQWEQWQELSGRTVIDPLRLPTVLHHDREIAEREALRLATLRPGCQFVIFGAQAAAITAQVPTHTTLSGRVCKSRDVAGIVDITSDDELPF